MRNSAFARWQHTFCGIALALIYAGTAHGQADTGGNIVGAEAHSEEATKSHLEYYKELNKKGGKSKWKDDYPPATTCRTCHPVHYRQWSVSPHAYAQMSPVFNAMHTTLLKATNGSNGDFCIRCHTPVGMNRAEPLLMSNIDRHPTSREGITCIVCHRMDVPYGKISGRISLPGGDLVQVPAVGPTGGQEILDDLIEKGIIDVDAEKEGGRKAHAEAKKLAYISQPGFCGVCHDVLLHNGFRLEEAFSEYKRSPAGKAGITCQDCHMGKEHGVFITDMAKAGPDGIWGTDDDTGDKSDNYDFGPAAVVDGKPTASRKFTNHMFPGPDHSVIHPGIFPHNDKAVRDQNYDDPETSEGLATIREWLTFDHKAGWGTIEFEKAERDRVRAGGEPTPFPEVWATRAQRLKARKILNGQFELLQEYAVARDEVLRAGFTISDIKVTKATPKDIRFEVDVFNATNGHGVPTGFIGERVMFLQVRVLDEGGNLIYASGDLDPNGDVRDSHSLYVHNHELPLDKDLFTLQSRFLTTSVRGGEVEAVLPVPISLTPLPFIRPQSNASTLEGRPRAARIHKNNIMPGDSRTAKYRIKKDKIPGPGKYKIDVKFIVGMVPINLVDAIKGVGFDYGMSAADIAQGVLKGHTVLWHRTAEIEVD